MRYGELSVREAAPGEVAQDIMHHIAITPMRSERLVHAVKEIDDHQLHKEQAHGPGVYEDGGTRSSSQGPRGRTGAQHQVKEHDVANIVSRVVQIAVDADQRD